MKSIKTLALMLVALVGMTACSNDDEQKKFIIDPVEGLKGYIFVTSGYFTDSYYGNDATVSVTGNKNQYNISFHDPQWGDVTFENVELDEAHGTVSGSGKLSMNYRGKPGRYAATLSGNVEKHFFITMPEVMKGKANDEKGTIISFYPGEAPLACKLEGSYSGTNNIMVGGQSFPAGITYKVTANPDGSINLSLPEYQVDGTPMGDLTLGAYTLKNIPYDKEKGAFYRLYGEGVKEHLTAVKDGNITMDKEYDLDEEGSIQVEKTENGIRVTNSFQPIPMPFAINAIFETDAK